MTGNHSGTRTQQILSLLKSFCILEPYSYAPFEVRDIDMPEHMLKCSAAGNHFVYYCQNFILPELALNWMARQLMAGLLLQHRAQGRIKAMKSNHLFT